MQADTLSFYGSGFQNKVLALLLKDRAFLQQVHDIIDPKFFSSESSQWLANTALKYFSEYKSPPTLEVLKVQLDQESVDLLKTAIVENIKEVLKYLYDFSNKGWHRSIFMYGLYTSYFLFFIAFTGLLSFSPEYLNTLRIFINYYIIFILLISNTIAA